MVHANIRINKTYKGGRGLIVWGERERQGEVMPKYGESSNVTNQEGMQDQQWQRATWPSFVETLY